MSLQVWFLRFSHNGSKLATGSRDGTVIIWDVSVSSSFILQCYCKEQSWPALSVWVFIAHLVEHCSANAEAMGSNPVKAAKNFFSGYFAIALIVIHCDGHIFISFVFPQFT